MRDIPENEYDTVVDSAPLTPPSRSASLRVE